MAKNLSFEEIRGSIRLKKFQPVYLFQGEEGYFIDELTDAIVENALDDSERDFNQTIVYGPETNTGAIINACKRFPMMSERQLVVVKEAQSLRNIDDLSHYVKAPLNSTILVINVKHGKLDGRKKLTGEIAKNGIVFESKKLYENQIPNFILTYLRDRDVKIDFKAAQLLTDYLGNDLSKLTNELGKLLISLPKENPLITSEMVEQNTGISKDYNNFELQRAIAGKDILKANRIALYFQENPKNNPLIMTLTLLFGYFSNLMICHYEKDKSESALMATLGFRFSMQVADYTTGLRNYSALKTLQNVSLIREFDAKSKGFGNASLSDGELLKELVFKLMH
jgi:DNA polymerase III, delta subunit